MTSQVVEGRMVPVSTGAWVPASLTRRLVAFVLDVVVLAVGFTAALAVGVSLVDEGVVGWLLVVWIAVVAPLYFALYHAFGGPERGPGWTPGQHELRICVRDARTGGRISLGRALVRAYGGLVATVLVLPLLADLASLMASRDARAWHDRLVGSEVSNARAVSLPTIATAPTAPAQVSVFEPVGRPGARVVARARRLLAANRRILLGSTLLLYLGLLGLGAVLVPLFVSDYGGSPAGDWYLATWLGIAVLLFASGLYWAQATVSCAVEVVRTGEPGVSLTEIVRRAARRANALSVAVVLLVPLLLLTPYTMFMLLVVVARLALVVPVIVLEDETVLGSFGRSWRLTRRKTMSVLGLTVVTLVVLGVAIWLVALAGVSLARVLMPDDIGVSTEGLGAITGLAVASLPLSALTALVGCAWCLLFYDLRRAAAERGDG